MKYVFKFCMTYEILTVKNHEHAKQVAEQRGAISFYPLPKQ